jgi:hypothetical protein
LVFNAFYQVADKAGIPIKMNPKQLVKFANYFSSKRHVATLRSAYYLTKVFKYLSDNKVRVIVVLKEEFKFRFRIQYQLLLHGLVHRQLIHKIQPYLFRLQIF